LTVDLKLQYRFLLLFVYWAAARSHSSQLRRSIHGGGEHAPRGTRSSSSSVENTAKVPRSLCKT